MRRGTVMKVVPIAFLSTCLTCAGCLALPDTIAKYRANTIIELAERHYQQHGKYALNIEELSQAYPGQVRVPTWGVIAWGYSSNGSTFHISYHVSPYTHMYAPNKGWQRDRFP